MFRVDFGLFEFFVVVLFDLLVEGFFDFLLDPIFFILLVTDPVIFEHSFFHGGLIDQLVFEFHVLVFLLLWKFLVVLVDLFVLAEVFEVFASSVVVVVLVLQIFHLVLPLFPEVVFFLLVFLTDLLVQSVENSALHVFTVPSVLFFGFVADFEVVAAVVVFHAWIFGHFELPGVLLLGLFSLDNFLVFLSFLFLFHVVGLLGDEIVVPAISLFLLLIDVVFGAELTVKLAPKNKKMFYLKLNFFSIARSLYCSLRRSYSRALYWLMRAHYYLWGECSAVGWGVLELEDETNDEFIGLILLNLSYCQRFY